MAITGPFTRNIQTRDSWNRATWYRQKAPYRERLQFVSTIQKVVNRSGQDVFPEAASMPYPNGDGSAGEAYNKAYKKFVERLGDRSSWGVNVAERKQALDMMVDRLGQIVRFTRALRKGRLGDAARALELQPGQSFKKQARDVQDYGKKLSKSRKFANTFLEYHFGWAPLMSDIFSSCQILTREFTTLPIKGYGNAPFFRKETGSFGSYSQWSHTSRVQIIADVRFDNPNLLLLSQLGLVNPAVLAWEVVPFSFVVDWFVNVGDFLSSFTDTVGCSLSGIAVTNTKRGLFTQFNGFWNASFGCTYSQMSRDLYSVLPGPTLQVRPFKGLSVSRGVTAVSLLLQQLKVGSVRRF